jgi:tRNA(fMet)-specific endonuclease VapC
VILLDTNTCIYIINNRPPNVLERFKSYQAGEVGISSIAASELAFGVAKSGSIKNRKALDMFLAPLQILSFNSDCLWFYAELRATLEMKGL